MEVRLFGYGFEAQKLWAQAGTLLRHHADQTRVTGFMTFAPEWLTANQWLDGSNFMYLWVYLVFFNTLWVWIPAYAIYVSWNTLTAAFNVQTTQQAVKKTK